MLASREGPSGEIGLLFSVQHLKKGGREISFCGLWLTNRELLVRFIKRKNTISKNVTWEL